MNTETLELRELDTSYSTNYEELLKPDEVLVVGDEDNIKKMRDNLAELKRRASMNPRDAF